MANARIFTQKDFEEWGRIGGAKGRGKAKARSPEHYERLSKLGLDARLAKKQARAQAAQ